MMSSAAASGMEIPQTGEDAFDIARQFVLALHSFEAQVRACFDVYIEPFISIMKFVM